MPATSSASRATPSAPTVAAVVREISAAGIEDLGAQARLDGDYRLIAQWREELEARQAERLSHQAIHRDQLEDAFDHLSLIHI
jgi:S-DNA-T family DNA segregation ATPase FtsK/SpoIIIE